MQCSKADGRSKKLKVIHFSKLKKCFGKPPIVPISNRDHSIEETSMINESQERVTPAPESQSERNRMACAKRSENQQQQPLGQVRGKEHSSAIIHDQSEFTVTRKLSKGHGSSENGVKTRATTTTTRTSRDFLTKKSTQIPAKELSRIEEEQKEWENEELPPMTNTSQLQGESEEEAVSKKTSGVLPIQ